MSAMVHPDREGLAPWLRRSVSTCIAVLLILAGMVTSSTNGQPTSLGMLAGLAVALLAVWGLPSVSLRLVTRVAVLVSGTALARFATVGPDLRNGTQTILLWVLVAAAALVLANRVEHRAVPVARAGAGAVSPSERKLAGLTAAHVVLVGAVAIAALTVLAPFAVSRAGSAAASGRGPTSAPMAGSSPLRSTNSFDMTDRPDLSDEVVLTVRTSEDLFLRGDVFDVWDGERWTRRSMDRYALLSGDEVAVSPIDLSAAGDDVVRQTIEVEAGYADVFFAAPTAVAIEARQPVAQTLDGTLLTARGAMGRGETYTVTSRRHPLSAERLRATDRVEVPQAVLDAYASPPVTTDRVEALAEGIVADAGATTTYDRIRAFEAWMDDNVEYSIDAPAARPGVDAVDEFLFDDRLGWCEKIASALVVMARSEGIPARLATGFVATERDRVTGTYVVRAKHAHAWAEVWFPEVGWVQFDPTAGVPLAATDPSQDTIGDWLLRNAVQILVGTAAAVVAVVVGTRLVRRRLARRRGRPRTWAQVTDRRLTALGESAGVDRGPSDTATAYARRLGAEDLVDVGRVVDEHLYAPVEPSADRRSEADSLLRDFEAREAERTADRKRGPRVD